MVEQHLLLCLTCCSALMRDLQKHIGTLKTGRGGRAAMSHKTRICDLLRGRIDLFSLHALTSVVTSAGLRLDVDVAALQTAVLDVRPRFTVGNIAAQYTDDVDWPLGR